jgi:hypothetical protein
MGVPGVKPRPAAAPCAEQLGHVSNADPMGKVRALSNEKAKASLRSRVTSSGRSARDVGCRSAR